MPPEQAAPIIGIERCPIDDPELFSLIGALDAELDPLYPDDSQHGYSLETLKNRDVAMFIARIDGLARACGGIELMDDMSEIKRMYVHPEARGIGLAQRLLETIETFAKSNNKNLIRLETGIYQHAAVKLYRNAGYREIGAFPPYRNDPLSLFMEKRLR